MIGDLLIPATALEFTVVGTPAPQGSKRHVGHGVMVESSKKVRPWRQDVRAAALAAATDAAWTVLTGPVRVELVFRFARPRGHYRTGRNAHLLRDSAPGRPCSRSSYDVDKLVRSTLDALVEAGCVLGDDAQVSTVLARKVYVAAGEAVGAVVRVCEDRA